MAEFGIATVSTLSAKPNFTPFIATVTTLVVISLEEDSSLLLELEDSTELLEDFESLDFAELEDAASELEDASTLELDLAELLDFAELEDAASELEDATTLELDCAELEDTTTLELDCTAELLDCAELLED